MTCEEQQFLDPEATDCLEQAKHVQRPGRCSVHRTSVVSGLVATALLAIASSSAWRHPTMTSDTSQPLGFAEMGKRSICGVKEDIEETTCAEEGSLVRSQGRATAYMSVGCTAWLVKSETSYSGALMLTTGHCAKSETVDFVFDYVKPCGGSGGASKDKVCKGTRKLAKVEEDEEAIYELEKPCSVVHTRTPIHLDVGSPDVDEGVYIIGHPNGRPQVLSHEEVHDNGQHCRLTSVGSNSNRRRVNAFYYCDTQGGNSGSPVFSARTGHAIAIHKWGGCSPGGDGNNGGTLLKQSTVKKSLRHLKIPFVNRQNTDLSYQGVFSKAANCEASTLSIDNKDLEECKNLCLNGLSCTAIAHSASQQRCYITAARGTETRDCPADAQYFTLRSRSLYRAPPRDGSDPSGLCTNTCKHKRDGECDDGGHNSQYSMCSLGTDCDDCGIRHEGKNGKCANTCKYANDGVCDDGGPKSAYAICELGTDCDDCGTRSE